MAADDAPRDDGSGDASEPDVAGLPAEDDGASVRRGERVDAKGRVYNVASQHEIFVHLCDRAKFVDIKRLLTLDVVLEQRAGPGAPRAHHELVRGRDSVLEKLRTVAERVHAGRIAHIESVSLTALGETKTTFRSAPRAKGRREPFRVAERISWSEKGLIERIVRVDPAPPTHREWVNTLADGDKWVGVLDRLHPDVQLFTAGGRVVRGKSAVGEELGKLAVRMRGRVRHITDGIELSPNASQVTISGRFVPPGAARAGAPRAADGQTVLQETLCWNDERTAVRAITHAIVSFQPAAQGAAERADDGARSTPNGGGAQPAPPSSDAEPDADRKARRQEVVRALSFSDRLLDARSSRAAPGGHARARRAQSAGRRAGSQTERLGGASPAELRASLRELRASPDGRAPAVPTTTWEALHAALVRMLHAGKAASYADVLAEGVRLRVTSVQPGGVTSERALEGRDEVGAEIESFCRTLAEGKGVLRAEPVVRLPDAPRGTSVGYAIAAQDENAWADSSVVKVHEAATWGADGSLESLERVVGAPLTHHDFVYFHHHAHRPARGAPALSGRASSHASLDVRVSALLADDVQYDALGGGRWLGKAAVSSRLALECTRMKGRVAVIGRVVRVSYSETEVVYAGTWTPMGQDGQQAIRRAHTGGRSEFEPTACVLERIEWTEVAHPLQQRLVRRLTRIQLPHLHPELHDDWRQIRLRVHEAGGPWRGATSAARAYATLKPLEAWRPSEAALARAAGASASADDEGTRQSPAQGGGNGAGNATVHVVGLAEWQRRLSASPEGSSTQT